MWAKQQKYAKGQVRSSLNRLEILEYDEFNEIVSWRSVTAPEELFKSLLERNIKHFSQAKNTPFVVGLFGQLVHPCEQKDFSEQILNRKAALNLFAVNVAIQACVQEMQFAPGEDGTSPKPSNRLPRRL